MLRMTSHPDVASFLLRVGSWLEQRECEHGRILALAHQSQMENKPHAAPLCLTIETDTEVQSAALLTTEGVLELSRMSAGAIELLAVHLIDAQVKRIFGPEPVEQLVEFWDQHTSMHFDIRMTMRLYDCRSVRLPGDVVGRLRAATSSDLDVLASWWSAYLSDIGFADDRIDSRAVMKRHIDQQTVFVWDNGTLASMVSYGRLTRTGVAIFGVYTPPDLRGFGFASASTAALTQQLLDTGRQFCCLYTDDANATSNAIYQDIGYRFVAVSKLWERSDIPIGHSK